ncbi:MAG: reverse transcriptase family protein, partial [Burkholderiales bacterium]|nr:reverse transcriptase family protein [Burkholderiales bacterium]
MNNYRPISLLSIFSKILEKIVCNKLTDFLETNSLLSSHQFGFRKSHSTTHPMTLLLNKLSSALNSKKHSIVIFCDLKKAFDTCNHSILLSKLYSIGVRGADLKWFESYLSNRQQFVTINDTDSLLLDILNGVPQGSILGPLLFLIYINDLPNCSLLFSFLFADDTALTASADSLHDLYSFVNTEFQKLCNYFRLNKLSLHPEKTKYLLITNQQTPIANLDLFINNNNPNENDPSRIHLLSKVTSSDKIPAIKYLGVYFDPNLNFKYHISQISKKLSNALFSLRRAKNLLPANSLKTLYYSLFHCHLVYAIEIWSSAPQSSLSHLFTKQKAAIRIITNSAYNAHTEPLFKSLSILPLTSLILVSNLKFFHSYVYNYLPSSFTNTWLTTIEQRQNDGLIHLLYNLRNNDDFFVPP